MDHHPALRLPGRELPGAWGASGSEARAGASRWCLWVLCAACRYETRGQWGRAPFTQLPGQTFWFSRGRGPLSRCLSIGSRVHLAGQSRWFCVTGASPGRASPSRDSRAWGVLAEPCRPDGPFACSCSGPPPRALRSVCCGHTRSRGTPGLGARHVARDRGSAATRRVCVPGALDSGSSWDAAQADARPRGSAVAAPGGCAHPSPARSTW